jgi:glycosyltransferase involved in cell wall biosynthesis
MQDLRISFIVPALNEEAVIAAAVDDLLRHVAPLCREFEVILIDDGSTDRTGVIMDELARENSGITVHHNVRNRGLGYAYRMGVDLARFDHVMLYCGDGGFPAESVARALAHVNEADIVIPVISNLRQIKTPFRYVLSRAYTWLLNAVSGLRIGYFNGLPIHRTALVRGLDIRSDGFGFQGEILIKLIKKGHSYVEVPVEGAEKTMQSTAMRLSSWISVFRTLLVLMREILRPVPGR